MSRPYIAFHFALVQDVAVLRPVVQLAAAMAGHDIRLLVSHRFAARDAGGLWTGEIARLAGDVGATPLVWTSPLDVLRHIGPGPGMIVAGSESTLPAHAEAHQLFRALSGRIRTVTLQHGLECVGFLHNERHDRTAGRTVTFAADIAVAWFALSRLHAVAASQRSKIYVAGPPAMIDGADPRPHGGLPQPGLVCENLHSVRFASARLRETFLAAFGTLAGRLAMIDEPLTLRPHPAGRFTERNAIALPANVTMRGEPLYDLDLSRYGYAISAPSTILFDFVLAGVPVAIWADPEGGIDTTNFAGLPVIAGGDDWWRFAMAARTDRAALIAGQRGFLGGLEIPKDVAARYCSLLALAA